MIHELNIPVYYEDTDAGGIVYYANYLKFAERARTEFLHTLGLTNKQMLADGFGIVVRRVEADYKMPARLEDVLTVVSTVDAIGAASMTMNQVIKRGAEELVHLKVFLAFVDIKALRPIRIHPDLKEKFKAYLGEEKCK